MLYSGSSLLLYLKIENNLLLIGGMRATKFSLHNQLIDSSNLESGIWRELVNGGGEKHVEISLIGSFSNSEAEQKIRKLAFNGNIAQYQISFANGEIITGGFQIKYYERFGEVKELEQYVLSLSSSREVFLIDY